MGNAEFEKQQSDENPLSEAHAASSGGDIITLPEDLSFKNVIKRSLVIPNPNGMSWLDIVRTEDKAYAIELLLDLTDNSPSRVNMRWAGGCKGFSPEDVENLFQFVAKGMLSLDGQRCFQGAMGSGGTMDINEDGEESVMVCQIPYYVARLTPCVAWGSTPQTFRLRRHEDSGNPVVSKYGAELDTRGHMSILTQDSATSFQNWNGDVRWYIGALESFARRGYAVAVGVVNGGDVTLDEALLAISKNIPVILVEGSGRAADQLAKAYQEGTLASLYTEAFRERDTLDFEKDVIPSDDTIEKLVHVVPMDNPALLSSTMDALGLLTSQ